MKEIWKDIKGYEGKYKVSNYGKIYSVKNDKILKNMVFIYIPVIVLYLKDKMMTFLLKVQRKKDINKNIKITVI